MVIALKIFVPTFIVILILNQLFYGACFEAYCIAAAFPKVIVLSLLVSVFIYWVKGSEDSKKLK